MKKIFAYIALNGALAACSNHADTYSPDITKSPNGSAMPNSVSSSIGEFIQYLHTAVNGMPASCIKKAVTSTNITKKRMAS